MHIYIYTYTVTACPPNVYSILVAPVKYSTSFDGPVCVTFSACNKIATRSYYKKDITTKQS